MNISRPEFEPSSAFAAKMDTLDPLGGYRKDFHLPKHADGTDIIYFTGNSLGLQPKADRALRRQELDDWAKLGVEGHVHAESPWLPYHEFLTEQMARIVGAKPIETVVMNSLTVNLHLLMVSFYRPTNERSRSSSKKEHFRRTGTQSGRRCVFTDLDRRVMLDRT